MHTKTKQASMTVPLTALKCLYKTVRGEKIVCEIDLSSLKKANQPDMIDEMIAEAKLEYSNGKTRGFTSTKKLMAYLNS